MTDASNTSNKYMSNAIGQNATLNAVSNAGQPDWTSEQFHKSAKTAADRKAKGSTREANLLKRQSLISMVCADYRNHFAAIYGRTDRLPSAIFQMVETAVDKVIADKLAEVNHKNVIGYRRAFHHNAKDMSISERVVVTGENQLTLQEQHLGVTIFITAAEKRLTDLQAKKTPDYDREKEVKAQIMRLNLTKSFIEGEIAHQKEATAKQQ